MFGIEKRTGSAAIKLFEGVDKGFHIGETVIKGAIRKIGLT